MENIGASAIPSNHRLGAIRRVVTVLLGLALFGVTAFYVKERLDHRSPSPARLASLKAHSPADMVLVPAGWFTMGSNDPDADVGSLGTHRVWTGSYYIDRYPVTKRQYARFSRTYKIPKGEDNFPITNLTFEQASGYLRSVGKALPTEAEWEKAARGPDGRAYPWGNTKGHWLYTCTGKRAFRAVDQYPQPPSPYGVRDVSGTVWQWVRDNVQGDDPSRHIIRGGAAGYGPRDDTTFARGIEGAGVT